ncbi:MAG: Uma2 family endonuclease [Crinalium sp.]
MKTYLPPQSDPLSPRQTLPTMYDLPSENPEEPGLPDEFHSYQPLLLRYTFKPTDVDSDEIFIGSDINLYYDTNHLNWYKRPDWFAVVGVSRLYECQDLRNSYVIWQESVSPFVVVELLSPGTENEDLGRTVRQRGNPPTKWQVYEQVLRVPYYIVFSRYTSELQAFRLVAGEYEAAELTNGRLLIPQLKLSLGLWEGSFENIERLWLRCFTLEGEMILTPTEESAVAQERAILAEQQAEKLAAKLRELGIDPNQLS